jgi:tetratricopeptide (TPR) repeat protein
MISNGFAQSDTDVNKDVDRTAVYEQVVKEGYGTPKIYKALGNAHYFEGNYTDAKKWFEKLFETEALEDPMLKFRYKQTLKALKLDPAANSYLNASLAESN